MTSPQDGRLADNANARIEHYVDERPPKFHEVALLDLMRADLGPFAGRLLDVGCASGAFLAQARERFLDATLTGIELSPRLVEAGRARWTDRGIRLEVADALGYAPATPVDVITAQGVLSIFQDPLLVLDRWLEWLSPGGRLYVFGRFNSHPMDVRISHRNRLDDHGWETGYTNYSIQTVTEHLERRGCGVTFRRFVLPTPIRQPREPNRSYTLELADGSRLLVNGANLIVEQYFLAVTTDPRADRLRPATGE